MHPIQRLLNCDRKDQPAPLLDVLASIAVVALLLVLASGCSIMPLSPTTVSAVSPSRPDFTPGYMKK